LVTVMGFQAQVMVISHLLLVVVMVTVLDRQLQVTATATAMGLQARVMVMGLVARVTARDLQPVQLGRVMGCYPLQVMVMG
jgi:hypothetical protein